MTVEALQTSIKILVGRTVIAFPVPPAGVVFRKGYPMAPITAADFEHAKEAAQRLLYAGSKLIETAIREPVTDCRGNETHYLTAEILALHKKLDEAGSTINRVLPYIKAVVDEPVEHSGTIATTVHSLAHDLAFRRVWLTRTRGSCLAAVYKLFWSKSSRSG